MTVEQKLLESHKDRVDGMTAFAIFIMKNICKMELDNVILYSAARQIVDQWLSQDVKTDEKREKNEN